VGEQGDRREAHEVDGLAQVVFDVHTSFVDRFIQYIFVAS
jgi:hypothetical protein